MVEYNREIEEMEKELGKMQYNKSTQKHFGLVRAKIAKLREAEFKRSGASKKGPSYAVRKSGDATVILIGFPSTGKSTLLNALTGTHSAVAAYAFTTLTVIPGLLEYNHAKIQVLDVPGIVSGAASGRGPGREVLSVIRSADLCIMVLDVNHPEHLPALVKEVEQAGLRLNQRVPDVKIVKKTRGGISLASTVRLTHLEKDTIETILREFRMNNADVVIRTDITVDQFIDVIEGNKVYIPAIVVLNKMDMVDEKNLKEVQKLTHADLPISAHQSINIDPLKKLMYERLDLIRVYCKEAGKKADLNVPLIMKRNSMISDMCNKLHKDFVGKFKFARVWGTSSKFPGQKLALKHVIHDKDVVEIHVR